TIETDKSKVDFTKGKGISDFKFYPDNPTNEIHRLKFLAKEPSRYYDPCSESSKMSINCLQETNYDREICQEYIDAYKECKRAWTHKMKQDKFNGR
ncbi:Cox23p ASCRUDRAFT_24973, partial [Ascoidea rubescens DSM 1968]